ncbi:hypothetical protein LK09_02575 [Microbacterium mangrovi]|uniref:Tandem-95 repeat protein n=1 Tax=Microbacterium mangrovi TaxID=1348253 RepID=A0A0B2AD73_9MICO|nr:Ig-like domain-containing protein [Microbacterium mangrovi]KHK99532.1 hypothetical protein LK09_02575 [Microbacterium mangrovi]
MGRRKVLLAVLAAAAAVASVVAVSVVWPGLDAKQTPPAASALWALQTGTGRHYARVNTAVGELDTVRTIENPTSVAQVGSGAYLFADSFGKLARIDQAQPADLDNEALRHAASTPAGTVDAAVAGGFVAYRTDAGAVYAGRLGATPVSVQPGDGTPGARGFSAEAITVDDAGTVFAASRADGAVLRFSIPQGRALGQDAAAGLPPGSDDLAMTAAGGTWFLADRDAGRVWSASGARALKLVGTVAAGIPSATSGSAWIADDTGLVRLPADGSKPVRVTGGGTTDLGTPTQPIVQGGTVYAGWLGTGSGTLWRGSASGAIAGDERRDLSYGGHTLPEERRPVLTAAGSSVILNDTRSGWVWDATTGRLLPSSQDWTLGSHTNPASDQSQQRAPVVIDPKPPVAESDSFGVRAGALVPLPVLLNDHDPNEDVLSIDPQTVSGLPSSFGTVSVVDQNQRLVVQVAPGATGSASFRYRVTDGTAPGSGGGLYSRFATVTLTVRPASTESAPQWCPVAGCLATWPSPQVAPGGTVSVPVMNGWVDPDGDPVMLLGVQNPSGVGSVATTATGDVVYRHPDPSETRAQVIPLTVTVGDTRGRTTTRTLTVRVAAHPKLTAESFTVVDAHAQGLSVDTASHVTGTAGRLSLSSVRVLDEASAEAVPTAGTTSFDFTAAKPGTYRVAYTVTDGSSDATATARITVLPPDAPADLATAPVTAFVRPKQDVTLDVFAAVSNPTHRVLLLSDITPAPAAGASMSVDAVGQNYLRISGSTATGEPGLLGTVRYTVSDGSGGVGGSVTGQATVYLLPPPPELAPIAVDDQVVVRVGAQVDIPVLDNDVSTSGQAMTLDPASVRTLGAAGHGSLAFASGRMLRYLAPTAPGQYRVRYAVSAAGAPNLTDSATVRITVIADGSNRAPRPGTLEGRVLTGQQTTIPFRSFGVDPDGDAVILDRVVTQPASGSAAISPDGSAIVYTSVPGFHGQAEFTYRVRDALGATGTGTVRVGVLDAQTNPSPVTFTDDVDVQAGGGNAVRISPLANDIDPTGGTLTLKDVRPDVVQFLQDGSPNPEYARLAARVQRIGSDRIAVSAGEDPGTISYLYDVESSTGNTARGRIVVQVVRAAVPDYPVVTDTALTAVDRDRFPQGIDVVAGHVSWTGGDPSTLTLSLWGDHAGLTVSGHRISGRVTDAARLIPFRLTGRTLSGEKVVTYGFLRIPGANQLPLTLKPNLAPERVKEGESVTWRMADLVALPAGAQLQVDRTADTTGARAQARCTVSGGSVTYAAGKGAPWADACVVSVRLAGQTDWTHLSVPIQVIADAPVPQLSPASVTVGPGQTASYDLRSLTVWQGPADWAHIVYTVAYRGADFTVTQSGSHLRIAARDAALPGAEEVAVVGVSSSPGVAPARLILRVGAAPSVLPQGGTVAQQCSEASGSSCTVTVSGAPGEVNPLPHTPLRVVSVTSACKGIAFAVESAAAVRATWTAKTPGQQCTASVAMRDAQGRVTPASTAAHVQLNLQGYPQTPAAVSQVAYGDGTLTLEVSPGAAQQAWPAVTGYVIRSGGAVVATCGPDGTCPAIKAPNGVERVYTATSRNAVGESRGSVSTSGWAYNAPSAPASVTATPVPAGDAGGVVSLQIDGIDSAQTASLHITSATGDTVDQPVRRGQSSVTVAQYTVGSNRATTITVTPVSRFELPAGLQGTPNGQSRSTLGTGIGAPQNLGLSLSSQASGSSATITASGSADLNGDGSSLRYGFALGLRGCQTADSGASAQYTVSVGRTYTVTMCVESWFGGQEFASSQVSRQITAYPDDSAPKGYTFQVDGAPKPVSDGAQWLIRSQPTSDVDNPPAGVDTAFSGYPSDVIGSDPGIRVWHEWNGWRSASAAVVPAAGSAPYQVAASWQVSQCTAGSAPAASGTSTGGGATFAFDFSGAVYRNANGKRLTTPTDGTVPAGAVSVSGVGVVAHWSNANWNLGDATDTFGGTCTPGPDPTPTP